MYLPTVDLSTTRVQYEGLQCRVSTAPLTALAALDIPAGAQWETARLIAGKLQDADGVLGNANPPLHYTSLLDGCT